MIIECKIADNSPIVNRTVGEVQNAYKIKVIHMHKGLPPIDIHDPLRLRLNPPSHTPIQKGLYIKFNGLFENAIKFAKVASSS